MRRTLLAVGIAVLASMLFAPHEKHWQLLPGHNIILGPNPNRGMPPLTLRVPDGFIPWHWFPIFWIEEDNPVLWANFAGQTAFVAVLAAVLVNLGKSSRRSCKLSSMQKTETQNQDRHK